MARQSKDSPESRAAIAQRHLRVATEAAREAIEKGLYGKVLLHYQGGRLVRVETLQSRQVE